MFSPSHTHTHAHFSQTPRHLHMDLWPEDVATLRFSAGCATTMQSWHAGVPVCFRCLLSQYALEEKWGNPSVIFLMLGQEKQLPLTAHPSHGHGHSPEPAIQTSQEWPSALTS